MYHADVALTDWPLIFLAVLSFEGAESIPLFASCLKNYIIILFTFFQGIACNRLN